MVRFHRRHIGSRRQDPRCLSPLRTRSSIRECSQDSGRSRQRVGPVSAPAYALRCGRGILYQSSSYQPPAANIALNRTRLSVAALVGFIVRAG